MANRRTIKHNITAICGELFGECIAQSLYDNTISKENVQSLLHSILKIQCEYTSRISHVEPGLPAKKYFKDLTEKFNADVSDIIDQINNLH